MKNLIPFLLAFLLFMSSCELFTKKPTEIKKLTKQEIMHLKSAQMQSICQGYGSSSEIAIQMFYSIDPSGVDVSEIEKIEFKYSFSDGGLNLGDGLNVPSAYEPEIINNSPSDNILERNVTLYPNASNSLEGNNPFQIAEVMIDMPGMGGGGSGNHGSDGSEVLMSNKSLETTNHHLEGDAWVHALGPDGGGSYEHCVYNVSARISDVKVIFYDEGLMPKYLIGCSKTVVLNTCDD